MGLKKHWQQTLGNGKWEGREENDVRPFSIAATPASPAVLFAFSIVSFAVSAAVFLNSGVVVKRRADGTLPATQRVVRRRRDIFSACLRELSSGVCRIDSTVRD